MPAESLTLFDIVPGRVIADRFTVIGPNRQGGFSTAFEVTDAKDGARCEFQLFPAGLFEGDDQAGHFCERLRPWAEAESDAIVGVRDILELDAHTLALVTEFPVGESLRARLTREKLVTRDEVLAIGTRLLEGLEQVHAKGLFHGDIKPNTIWVDGTGEDAQPQLVDGGVTSALWTAKDLGARTALIGTPFYAPVEQFGGDAPDVRSDIYNVAAVLYECAVGVLPWAAKTFLEVFQAKLLDPKPMRERARDIEVDAEFDEAIRKGCFADRNRRYASAAEFRAALERLK